MDKTRVIFRKDKTAGVIVAFFPSEAGTRFYAMDCRIYTFSTAHGTCTFNYYYETTVPAKPEEYKSLLEKLQTIYNNTLVVSHRMTHKDYLNRRKQVAGW